jgi:hypothetical protein
MFYIKIESWVAALLKGVLNMAGTEKERAQMFLRDCSDNILQLEQIYDVYKQEIVPIFSFDNQKREDFISEKMSVFHLHYEEEDKAYDVACDILFMREKMLYQHRCFTIVQLYSLFEQQILRNFRQEIMQGNFVTKKADKRDRNKPAGSPYYYAEFNQDTDFKYMTNCLEYIKNADKVWWNEKGIKEIQLLNNAIKHGLGKCFEDIKLEFPLLINDQNFLFEEKPFTSEGIRPPLLINSSIKSKKLAHSTLFDEVFLLTDEKIEFYKNVLVDFWSEGNQLPNGFYISFQKKEDR